MAEPGFRLFGVDCQVYGPVPVATLLEWARDGRVLRTSWVHSDTNDIWRRADELPELEEVFRPIAATPESPGNVEGPARSQAGVPVKALTRLKVFSDMSAADLEPFARELVEESYRPFTYIVQQGSKGEAMYMVIQGKVGVSTRGQVTESFLVTLNVGDTFGEMSLFEPMPRSADVRAENDVIVLKLTVDVLRKVCREAPASANKFFWNIAHLLSSRVRSMDKRAAVTKDMDAAGRAIR